MRTSEATEILVAEFATRTEAELALGALRANGIQARMTADDAGGERPDIGLSTGGVKIYVLAMDLADARRVLGGADRSPG